MVENNQGISIEFSCGDKRTKITRLDKEFGVHSISINLYNPCKEEIISKGFKPNKETRINKKTWKSSSSQLEKSIKKLRQKRTKLEKIMKQEYLEYKWFLCI